jgi:glycosyltransferase involved in cell wall biosynthesis
MPGLSAVIITFNEEDHITRCIQSVKSLADEILVLDSGSTDRTVAIARGLGATVYQEKFRGYIQQKNRAMDLATYDHILSLDADEMPDARLIESIRRVKNSIEGRAFSMNRCTRFCGRFLRHGLWYPDRKIRLFDRRIAHWGGLNPHDKIIVRRGTAIKHLKGDILHYAFNSIEELITRNDLISSVASRSLYETGRRSSWYKMLVHPAWAFFNGYILRFGFLDRFAGFCFAVNTAHQVFLKYSKLYRLQQCRRSGPFYRRSNVRVSRSDKIAGNV